MLSQQRQAGVKENHHDYTAPKSTYPAMAAAAGWCGLIFQIGGAQGSSLAYGTESIPCG